ncbi:MAG TPA: non-homologous end-joining DNA ligase [Acidimicrobiales bacterium]
MGSRLDLMDRFFGLPEDLQARLRAAPHPDWVEPMLATLTDAAFSDPAWLFERKLDGQRVLAFRNGSEVRLFSRNHNRLNGTYPELVDALATQPADDFVIDGEVVAFDRHGNASFSRLQQRFGVTDEARSRHSRVHVFYYVFDLMHLDGHDTTALPLRTRKQLLRQGLSFRRPLRYSAHRNGAGEAYFAEASAKNWEGIMGKRADGPYVSGRSKDWLKIKHTVGQELVIGGFTEPGGSREGFGALLVGYYDGDGVLRFAGKVGTGYTPAVLLALTEQLRALEVPASPFTPEPAERGVVHWVRPELVAEVGFSEWTNDGKLRHPRFKGLRNDKAAWDVVREAK